MTKKMNRLNKKNIENIYRLSPIQEGLLFHTLNTTESGMYCEQMVFPWLGLNVAFCERAWQKVVNRHSILRTSFHWENINQPLQIVHRKAELSLEHQDWRNLCVEDQKEHFENYLKEDQHRGFDLAEAPLMRVTLIHMSDEAYQIIWSYHHLLLDGWSAYLVLAEYYSFYRAFSKGDAVSLKTGRPYRDYITWLRQQDLSKAEEYWRLILKDFTMPTPLGVEKRSDDLTIQIEDYNEEQISLSKSSTKAMQSFTSRHHITLSTLIQSGWGLLLSRYSGEKDVIFGAVISGRSANLKGIESMVGLFINTLPVRIRISSRDLLLPWLENFQIQQSKLHMYEHSPLVQVHGWSQVPRGVPLFKSIIGVENYPVHSFKRMQDIRVSQKTNYPLTVIAEPGEILSLRMVYDHRYFDSGTINRMLRHFKTLLESMVINPEGHLSDLQLLTQEEQHQILVTWNAAKSDYPTDLCIHQLFEHQVKRTPDAVAVSFDTEELNYQKLNSRANQLAHHLRKMGVKPEVFVGIYMERSMEMIVAILAIVKAGGAYVPLDTTYPKERLRFMLEDTNVSVLLTQKRMLEKLPENKATVILLDSEEKNIAKQSTKNPVNETTPENLIYVMYTSGSTGKPKGICITHKSISRLLFNTNYINLGPGDKIAQVSNSSFDAATFEIWGALLFGAQLVGIKKDVALSPHEFVSQLRKQKITVLFLTTALFNQCASEVPQAFKSIRVLLFGGEAVDPKWVKKLLDSNPPEQLLHVYGPTESTTFSSWYLVKEVKESATTIPIGSPISNTKLYILDSDLRPVPIEVPGELYVGGDGLARGYLNRPGLTAENFIPDPFSRRPGMRLYRTGDLACYLADGNIEFRGRIDYQIKIRGFRVELREVEAALREYAGIRDVIVILRDDVADKRLVAYLVAEDHPSVPELRKFLQEKLPDYMIPSAFVILDDFPVTPNGKIDRKALPAPDSKRPELRGAFVAPHTDIEKKLAEIWANILGINQIGIYDSFFELGGHSLLATQLISQLRVIFHVDLILPDFFKTPTIHGMAKFIEGRNDTDQWLQVLPITPISRDRDIPVSFAQERLWFFKQWESNSPVYNILSCIHFKGLLDVFLLERCFNEIIRRHESLRSNIITVNGRAVQRISSVLTTELSVVDIQVLSEREKKIELQRLATKESQYCFELERDPLIRAKLLQLAEEEHVLLITMDHIVADGWSLGLLVKEMAVLYEAFSKDIPSPLPDLPIQYADFAHWQRKRLEEGALENQLSYWKNQLSDMPPVLELAADHWRSPTGSFRGAKHPVVISEKLTETLKNLSEKEGCTLFMTLLTAFQTLLYRYTGQEDIVVGTPIANRNMPEIEGLIGFFANTLVLRTDLSGNPGFKKVLKRVREMAIEAYAHQDMPFEKLVQELHPQRDSNYNPLFQVMFVLQNTPISEMKFSDITMNFWHPTWLKVDNGTTKFDLTLDLSETTDGLTGFFEYSTDLFEAGTITRITGHFQTLLESIVEHPDQPVSKLPILSQSERQQLVVDWNETRREYPRSSCIHQLFEERVEQNPKAVAVVFENLQLNYAELNIRANRLAHYLRNLGIGPDVLVGICMERSLEMVVGILGILKAGGAYLPLDPDYPDERLKFMLEDSQVAVLLTQESFLKKLPEHKAHVVCLDTDWENISNENSGSPVEKATADNLAYVIYTSGSTGKPKGVLLEHRGLCNLAKAQIRAFHVKQSSRVLQFASLGFDASVSEIFMALVAGATLCLGNRNSLLAVSNLSRLLREQAITTVTLPPSILANLSFEKYPALRTIVVAGEECSAAIVERWGKNYRLLNAYGPSECTVCATFDKCNDSNQKPLIGRPIDNVEIYLLDSHLEPVPVGIPGELHIGGVGLARGFINRPELTAEKFIPNPFGSKSGTRLYRTGDLARYLPDSRLEFLGRIDNQVKIRGFRVELGEIQTILLQHFAVQDAVVITHEDASHVRCLSAYIVPTPGQTELLTVTRLRGFLKRKLPDYMVPSNFFMLEALPLTPNKKVDRSRLPEPNGVRPKIKQEIVIPRDALEFQLVQIWENILDIYPIGIMDDFFDLGGHSILAVHLIARIQKVFNKNISLSLFFQNATIVYLASILRRQTKAFSGSPLVGIQTTGSKRPFFCVHPVGGNVLCYAGLARSLSPKQPFYGLQAMGLDGEQEPYMEIRNMAARYLEAICEFQAEGPYLLGGWSMGGIVAFEMAQQLQKQGQKVALLALFDVYAVIPENLRHELNDVAVLVLFLNDLAGRFGRKLSLEEDKMNRLSSSERLKYVLEHSKMIKVLPQDIELSHLENLLEVFRVNLTAQKKYIPRKFAGTITLFQASELNKKMAYFPELSWREVDCKKLKVHTVTGNHYTMLAQPHVKELAIRLQQYINEAEKESTALDT